MATAAESSGLAELSAFISNAYGDAGVQANYEPDNATNNTEPFVAAMAPPDGSMPNGYDTCSAAAPANEDTTVHVTVPEVNVQGGTSIWVWWAAGGAKVGGRGFSERKSSNLTERYPSSVSDTIRRLSTRAV